MKTAFYVVSGCTLVVVLAFLWAWVRDEENARVERWASRYYGAYPRLHDADNPSRLDRLRKIAAAQHSQDQ